MSAELNPYRRITVEETDQMLRIEDTIVAGSVTLEPIPQLDCIVLDSVSNMEAEWGYSLENMSLQEAIDGPLSSEDEELDIVDELKAEEEFEARLRQHRATTYWYDSASLLSKMQDSSFESRSERQTAIVEILSKFSYEHGSVSLDPNTAGSLLAIRNFVNFYTNIYEQTTAEVLPVSVVEQFRQDMLDTIDSRQVASVILKPERRRIKDDITRVPIIIIDPITAELQAKENKEFLGWFIPSKRRCYIDPLSISNVAVNIAEKVNEDDVKSIVHDIGRTVVFHELFHAATNDTYVKSKHVFTERYEQGEHLAMSKKNRLWPKFFDEAMVEKLANFINAVYLLNNPSKTAHQAFYRGNITSSKWRIAAGTNPRDLVNPKSVAASQNLTFKTYAENRLLMDTVFDRLDWESAGLTRVQAEKLLLRAFLERPTDVTTGTPAQRWPMRKAFLSAVGKAGFPGLINKLGMISDLIGVNEALDIVEDPNFDIHDSSQLPWLLGKQRLQGVNHRPAHFIERKQRTQERYERLVSLNVFQGIVNREINLLQKIDKDYMQSLDLNEFGIKALRTTLAHRHGTRRRQRLDIIEADFLSFRNSRYNNRDRRPKVYPIDSQAGVEAEKNLAAWQTKYNTHK